MQPLNDSRIAALVSLLTDENPRVYAETRRVLRLVGKRAVPLLEAAEASNDACLRARSRLVHQELRIHLIVDEMQHGAQGLEESPSTLEECCTILARGRFPDLDSTSIAAALDAMADDLATRIHGLSSQLARARTLSRFFANELGFHGNRRNYSDPDNSYLNRVLDRRLGIPISLSSIYLFVGRRLGLPLCGIGMPGHFLLRYGEPEAAIYIDPFQNGRLLTESDCQCTLSDSDLPVSDRASASRAKSNRKTKLRLQVMDDRGILLRMVRNLQYVYRNRDEGYQVKLLDRLRKVLLRPSGSGKERRRGPIAGSDGGSSFHAG